MKTAHQQLKARGADERHAFTYCDCAIIPWSLAPCLCTLFVSTWRNWRSFASRSFDIIKFSLTSMPAARGKTKKNFFLCFCDTTKTRKTQVERTLIFEIKFFVPEASRSGYYSSVCYILYCSRANFSQLFYVDVVVLTRDMMPKSCGKVWADRPRQVWDI